MIFPLSLYNDLKFQKLNWYAKLVLFAIYSHSDNSGKCFPSINILAQNLTISEVTVYRALRKLIKSTLISKISRPGHNSIYQITPVYWTGVPLSIRHPCLLDRGTPVYWTGVYNKDCIKEIKIRGREETTTTTNPKKNKNMNTAYYLMRDEVKPVITETNIEETDLSKLLRRLPKCVKYRTLNLKCKKLMPDAVKLAGSLDKLLEAAENYKLAVLYNHEDPQAAQYWLEDQTYLQFLTYDGPRKAPEIIKPLDFFTNFKKGIQQHE